MQGLACVTPCVDRSTCDTSHTRARKQRYAAGEQVFLCYGKYDNLQLLGMMVLGVDWGLIHILNTRSANQTTQSTMVLYSTPTLTTAFPSPFQWEPPSRCTAMGFQPGRACGTFDWRRCLGANTHALQIWHATGQASVGKMTSQHSICSTRRHWRHLRRYPLHCETT